MNGPDLRVASARLLLAFGSLLLAVSILEVAFRAARVNVGTIQINRATIRRSGDPRLLFELIPNSLARAEVDYQVNPDGFRGPMVSLKKPQGTRRIIVLGDSIAFGYWVAERDSFPRQLESLLRTSITDRTSRIEVLNFGVPGYNLAQEIELLRVKALAYEPDVVIVAFCLNDLQGPLSYEFGLMQDRSARFSTPFGRIREAMASRSRFAAWVEYRLSEYEGRKAFVANGASFASTSATLDDVQQRALADSFRDLRALLAPRHAAGLVAIFPLLSQPFDHYEYGTLHHLVASIANEQQLEAVDLLDCFAAYDVRAVGVDIVHPNPLGQRIAAHAVRDAICRFELDCAEMRTSPTCKQYSPLDFPRVRGY